MCIACVSNLVKFLVKIQVPPAKVFQTPAVTQGDVSGEWQRASSDSCEFFDGLSA